MLTSNSFFFLQAEDGIRYGHVTGVQTCAHPICWRGVLPAPEFRGEYPVELRIGPGTRVLRSNRWLLRVFARGTLERPVYRSPEAVARWWVSTLPGPATLEAMKRWPRPLFDKRDPRLHQLLVVAYSLPGGRAVRDRLGRFVTAVRDEQGWRLLEATVTP